MRKKIIIANWKMNKDRKETISFLMTLNHMVNKNHLLTDSLDVVIAPSYLSLIAAKTFLSRGGLFSRNSLKKLIVAAQDSNSEDSGSFTGAVSYNQLKEEGINYSIVGHYETRSMYHLTDEEVNKKVLALTNNGMNAILCIGDKLEDKESGKSIEVILEQLEKNLKGVLIDNLDHLVIAYEPIYAIGTSNAVDANGILEVIKAIRNKISELYSSDAANTVRIIYGGSVNSANYIDYVNEDEIDGLLIGKSSLDVTSFYDVMYGTSQVIANKYPSLGNNYYLLKKKELMNTSKPLPSKFSNNQAEVEKADDNKNEDSSLIKNDIDSIKNIKESEIKSATDNDSEDSTQGN